MISPLAGEKCPLPPPPAPSCADRLRNSSGHGPIGGLASQSVVARRGLGPTGHPYAYSIETPRNSGSPKYSCRSRFLREPREYFAESKSTAGRRVDEQDASAIVPPRGPRLQHGRTLPGRKPGDATTGRRKSIRSAAESRTRTKGNASRSCTRQAQSRACQAPDHIEPRGEWPFFEARLTHRMAGAQRSSDRREGTPVSRETGVSAAVLSVSSHGVGAAECWEH